MQYVVLPYSVKEQKPWVAIHCFNDWVSRDHLYKSLYAISEDMGALLIMKSDIHEAWGKLNNFYKDIAQDLNLPKNFSWDIIAFDSVRAFAHDGDEIHHAYDVRLGRADVNQNGAIPKFISEDAKFFFGPDKYAILPDGKTGGPSGLGYL